MHRELLRLYLKAASLGAQERQSGGRTEEISRSQTRRPASSSTMLESDDSFTWKFPCRIEIGAQVSRLPADRTTTENFPIPHSVASPRRSNATGIAFLPVRNRYAESPGNSAKTSAHAIHLPAMGHDDTMQDDKHLILIPCIRSGAARVKRTLRCNPRREEFPDPKLRDIPV